MANTNENDADEHWTQCYSGGKDFRLCPVDALERAGKSLHGKRRLALDLGCGTGQLARELWHLGYIVLGIDVSRKAVELARRRSVVSDRFNIIHGDLERIDLPAIVQEPVHLAVLKLVLSFLHRPEETVRSITKLLADDGRILVVESEDLEKNRLSASTIKHLGLELYDDWSEYGLRYVVLRKVDLGEVRDVAA